MRHAVLVIDDEQINASNISKAFAQQRPQLNVTIAFQEEDIVAKIETMYFDVAVVDLRMDGFSKNGFDFIRMIIDNNPFARIIIMSAFLPEFSADLAQILTTGKVAAILAKETFATFSRKIIEATDKIISDYEANPSVSQKALNDLYAEAKIETDAYKKGVKFEQFVTLLFAQMGFNHIIKRFKDASSNEVDLIIRNEIKDNFFNKFKQYILVECKNTTEHVDKNQVIQFVSKLNNTSGLSDLGIIITSSAFKGTALREMIRHSDKPYKVILLTNVEIAKLIYANDVLDVFKSIVDTQIKDN